MLEKCVRGLDKADIDFLEECICTQSWWDSVDWMNKLVGIHFERFPELQEPYAEKWIASEDIWLQRVAIIHQLTYRENTDWELLKRMILHRATSSEFFVQKAAGWALRQYSKTAGDVVVVFVEKHPELPSLTRREALKWLRKNT